jgi:hypothetical protein
MKILGVGWFLIIILAVLQYNFKKERLHTQYLGKNGMKPNEKRDESRLIFEQERRKFKSSSGWEPLRNCLENLEKKTSDDE